MYTVLSLFSGIGGLCYQGLETAKLLNKFNIVECVEISEFAQKILKLIHPKVSIHSDILTYTPGNFFDIVCGGFPCTGTSQAGNKEGLSNIESSLWFEQFRIIKQIKPKIVLIENPEGILHRGGIEIIESLAKIGYVCQWETISASIVGLPQKRNRVFIIAYSNGLQFKMQPSPWKEQIGQQIARIKKFERKRIYKPSFRVVDNGLLIGIHKNTGNFELKKAGGLSCSPRQSAIAWLQINHILQRIKS